MTPSHFYMATCRYPLRKFKVKCAICGKWVENIWSHLAEAKHKYADSITPSEYEENYGSRSRNFMVVRTAIENEDGENTKLTDLVPAKEHNPDIVMDLQHSLGKIATTKLDKKIASVIKSCRTLDDIVDQTVERKTLCLSRPFSEDEEEAIKDVIEGSIGTKDFDIERPSEGSLLAKVVIPSKRTVYGRIKELRFLIAGM